MAVFAEVYGIRPWEWDRMAADDVLNIVRHFDDRKSPG